MRKKLNHAAALLSLGIKFARMRRSHAELFRIVSDQHRAIDHLMAMLIVKDNEFMPTKWKYWATVVRANTAIENGTRLIEDLNRGPRR